MKPRQLLFLLLVLAILIVIALWPMMASRFFPQPNNTPDLPFSKLTKQVIAKVTLKNQAGELELKKDGEIWKVGSYSASPKQIDAFFTGVSSSTMEAIVSRQSDNYQKYEVSTESGTLFTFSNGNTQTSFVVGKAGPELGTYYIRNMQTSPVYLVHGSLRDYLSPNLSFWRDKTIVAIPKETIAKIIVTGKQNFSVQKKSDTVWTVTTVDKTKDFPATDIALLDALTPLEGNDFVTPQEAEEFTTSPKDTVTIENSQGKVIETLSLLKKDTSFWVQSGAEVLKIYSYILDEFLALPTKIP